MSIQLQTEQKADWVVARFSGSSSSMKELVQHFPQIADECRRAKAKGLLIDFTQVKIPLSTMDRFDLGAHAVIFVDLGIKIACFATAGQLDPERFGELVAKNRGINVRTFADIRTAEDWLAAK